MDSAKDIRIKPIKASAANAIIRKLHYSGKVVPNSQIHLGVFLHGKLEGAMQYGPSMKKSGVIGLVSGTQWNEFIELNRMALSDALPMFSESRAIGVSMRLIRKHYPQFKWVISFSDGSQCGDGAIYRASGFILTQIKENSQIRINPATGQPMQSMAAYHAGKSREFPKWEKIKGFQLRYIYFIDKAYKEKLTVPILPFTDIDKAGAGMYKGKSSTIKSRRVKQANPGGQPGRGGAAPTCTLQLSGQNNG